MRRVVITGLGMVTPLGIGHQHNWERLIRGESGIKAIDSFDVSDLSSKIAGQVVVDPSVAGPLSLEGLCSAKEMRKMGNFIVYAIAATHEAILDANWKPENDYQCERTGVIIGSGIGGLGNIYEASVTLYERGTRRIMPYFIPSSLINLAAGQVSILFGFKGPNHAVVTACSTGAHAIGDAARLIQFEDADVMIAGGTEAAVNRLGLAGFTAARALSTHFNDTPERASRPYDQDRDGFVMGEGAGIVVLEALEHAHARGANIYAEIVGYGLSGDAYHITAPPEDGNGALRSMQAALKRAQLNPEDIDYINAHGTSTPIGDAVEVKIVKRLFGSAIDHVAMSSTKSAIGHLLGAAGAVEAIYSIKAINTNVLPPTLNLDQPSPNCTGIDLVPKQAKERKISTALSNSFGFGGTNATLIFKEYV